MHATNECTVLQNQSDILLLIGDEPIAAEHKKQRKVVKASTFLKKIRQWYMLAGAPPAQVTIVGQLISCQVLHETEHTERLRRQGSGS